MATPKTKVPLPIGMPITFLSEGNAPDPNAAVDVAPWLPQYGGTPQEEAQKRIDLEYGEKQRGIERTAREAALENARLRSVEQQYGREIDPRLEKIYAALGSSLEQRRGETQAGYNQALGRIGQFYDESVAANQGVNTDLLNRITQSAQQLGLGAAVPSATEQLLSNYQFSQGQLAGGRAGQLSNLQGLASKVFGLDTDRIAASAQEGAQQRASAQQEVLATLGELLRGGQQEQRGYREDLSGLQTDKTTALGALIDEITNRRSQDAISARSNALNELFSRQEVAQRNRAFEEEVRQFNEQVRQGELDRAAANSRAYASSRGRGGGSEFSLGGLLGNTEAARKAGLQGLLTQTTRQIAAPQKARVTGSTSGWGGLKRSGQKQGIANRSRETATSIVEEALGVAPGTVNAFLAPKSGEQKQPSASEKANKLRKTGSYQFAVNFVENAFTDAQGITANDAEAKRKAISKVRSDPYYKKNQELYELVFSDLF